VCGLLSYGACPATVLITEGSLHSVDRTALQRARSDWEPLLGPLPHPRVALLLGGPTARRPWQRAQAPPLTEGRTQWLVASACAEAAAAGGSVFLSTSRRTPPAARAAAERQLAEAEAVGLPVHQYHGGEPNPYLAYLASADYVVVTPDSINMVTEACAAAVPVYVPWTDSCRGRFASFHERLLKSERTRRWLGTLEPPARWRCRAVDDTARVAARVAELLLHSRPGHHTAHAHD
jgi:uncharacterized protein